MDFNLLCGIPGSGKSTLRQHLTGFTISTDAIRKFLWDDESVVKHDKLVFEMAEDMMKYMLSLGKHVIFDATNLKAERRMKYILLAKNFGANVIVHWIDCPLGVAISRNARRDRKVPVPVIAALYKSLEPPVISEGMDQLLIYNQELIVTKIIKANLGKN